MERAKEAAEKAHVAGVLHALASPTRLELLGILATPRHASDLAAQLGISRQAVRKHLRALAEAGLVRERATRRMGLRVLAYEADASAVFAARERLGLLIPPGPRGNGGTATLSDEPPRAPRAPRGAGLLVLHGAGEGDFLPFAHGTSWVLGRADDADVRLALDPFVSGRHAMLRLSEEGWSVEDLGSTNGSYLDFARLEPRAPRPLRPGAVLTLGRTHLLLRGGA